MNGRRSWGALFEMYNKFPKIGKKRGQFTLNIFYIGIKIRLRFLLKFEDVKK